MNERERESNKAIQNGSLDDDAKAKEKVHEREGLSLSRLNEKRERKNAPQNRAISRKRPPPPGKRKGTKNKKGILAHR